MKQSHQDDATRERWWAILRVALGTGQVMGATISLVLLIGIGMSEVTLLVVLITCLLTIVSIVLFRDRNPQISATSTSDSSVRGNTWNSNLGKKYAAEFFATFSLVFAGTGAIVINDVTSGLITHVGVSLTFGLIVLAMIYTVGDVSGAHLNPAVTLGFLAARRLRARQAAPYIFSQCMGALCASTLVLLLFPSHPTLGATLPAGSVMQSFVLEFVLTWLLMFVILGVSTGAKEKGLTAGIAIGGVIALEALFAGPVSGASMNPARSLGPALVGLQLDSLWIYLLAPPLGAFVAVLTCRCVRERDCCTAQCTVQNRAT